MIDVDVFDNEEIISVEICMKTKVIIKKGMDYKKLITEETDFLLEPKSTNGCVLEVLLKSMRKI